MAFQNFFATRLATDIGAADTTITLETAPTALSGRLTLEARNATQREIISYTGVSGNDITGVTRGEGGTTAKTHIKNALVEMNAVGEDLQDLRDAFDTLVAYAGDGWIDPADTPDTITANGNRSYNLVFNSADLTGLISPGMRLKLTRTVTAPTQCADLEASSSQYFSKSSPAGMTFTDDFVVSAWIKLESYAAANMTIASRYNGTSGWSLHLTANTGKLLLQGFNASAANYSYVVSSQSIPIGKWVHVAAQLDMSAFTATTTTSYVMIDGVNVPATVARAGTNPTALVQAGNLEIGSTNGGVTPFDGKIAQVAVYGAKVTQATVRASMSQALTGSETSLISAYSFNNSINDLSANANNLTAQNSAVATDTDSPFGQQFTGTPTGTTEYAIVMQSTFSTNTTLVVQVPEGSAIPTTGGVSAIRYSTNKTPHGFITEPSKWTLSYIDDADYSATATTFAALTPQLVVPIGAWRLGWRGDIRADAASDPASPRFAIYTLSSTALSSTTVESNELTGIAMIKSGVAASNETSGNTQNLSTEIKITAATTYIMYHRASAGSPTTTARLLGATSYPTVIKATNGYL